MKKYLVTGCVLAVVIVGISRSQNTPPYGPPATGGCSSGSTTSVLKGNGSGGCVAATAGTDYVGGQSALTTANTVPLVSSAGILGQSTISDNGTNVVLGRTTVPATDASTDLGIAASQRFRSLFLSGSITVGGSAIGANAANITVSRYLSGNCASSASPAVCVGSAMGGVVVAAGSTSVQVNTTALVNGSQIQLTFDSSLSAKLSVTCNTVFQEPYVSARTTGTSFTITLNGVAPVTNPVCVSYSIFN